MKCLIVDDDLFARCGIKTVIKEIFGDGVKVDEAVSSEECFSFFSGGNSYDIILVDYHLIKPAVGLDVLRKLKADLEIESPVIVVSADDDVSIVQEAFRHGASSFILKGGSTPEELTEAVEAVLQGRVYVSPRLAVTLLKGTTSGSINLKETLQLLDHREKQVLCGITRGWANKAIARQLDLSERRIKEIVTSIFKRFGVSTRAQLLLKLSTVIKLPYEF